MQNVFLPFIKFLSSLIVPQIASLIYLMGTVEDQDIQSTLDVLGQNLDSLSVQAITTHIQDHTVLILGCIAV